MKKGALRWLRRKGLALAVSILLSSGNLWAQAPAPIYIKNSSVRLPIQLEDQVRASLSEIKMYVRVAGGKWNLVAAGVPSRDSFDYQASVEGKHDFLFMTVDKSGRSSPTNPENALPHRTVIFDTKKPEVQLQVLPHRNERLFDCKIIDANPDLKTLKVFWQGKDGSWNPLAPRSAESATLFTAPSSEMATSRIRVSVSDLAGNQTLVEIDLNDPLVGLPVKDSRPLTSEVKPVEYRLPSGGHDYKLPEIQTGDYKLPEVKTPADVKPVDYRLPDVKMPDLKIPDVKVPDVKTPDLKVPDVKFPDVKTPDVKVSDLKVPDVKMPDVKGTDLKLPELPSIPSANDLPPIPKAPEKLPEIPSGPDLKLPSLPNTNSSSYPPKESTDLKLPPLESKPLKRPEIEPEPDIRNEAPSMLNTRTISVNYDLRGTVRVAARIDFWATKDNGKTWVPLKDESNGSSPARLTLPEDGAWGIRIRPGGNGKAPDIAEEADCVVEIDTIKPEVHLHQPTLGSGSEEGTLLITWTARDQNLLGNAIRLYYATKPEGPWEVVVNGYKNEGVYRWSMPPGIGDKVYLRLEAQDRAGNIGRAELREAFPLDSGKQRVKIISVGPAK